MSDKEQRISVLLDAEQGARFTAYCEEKGHKKSTLIARLVRAHLDAEQFQMQRSLTLTRRPED